MHNYDLWRMLLLMVIFTSAMAVCLFLDAYYHVPHAKDIGFGFVLASLGILIVIVIRVRKMFKEDMSGFGGSPEKTWRSYR